MNNQSDGNTQPSNPLSGEDIAQQILNQLQQMGLDMANMRTQFNQLSTRVDTTQEYIQHQVADRQVLEDSLYKRRTSVLTPTPATPLNQGNSTLPDPIRAREKFKLPEFNGNKKKWREWRLKAQFKL